MSISDKLDYIATGKLNKEQIQYICEIDQEVNMKDKEIERLNNIIDGMEKFFKYAYDNEVKPLNDRKISVWIICLDKLQELKRVDK